MYQISLILSVMNWVRVCLALPTLPYPLPYPTLPNVQNAAKQERRIWGAVSTLPHFLVQLRLP